MNVIIIDDERLAREELKSLLSKHTSIRVLDEAKNGKEGIQKINELQPDLIFLDIQMPEMDGFEMLKHVENIPKVVFVTAYDEYAIKAFEVNAFDYILKPVDPVRLKECIDKMQQPEEEFSTKLNPQVDRSSKILTAGDKIFLKDGEKCWFIDINEIRMFESDGNYVKVYFQKYRPMILRSLNSLEERLDPQLFFRANRKFIVNLNWVSGIENWFNGGLQVQLKENEKVEVSRRQAIRFKEIMSL